MRFHARPRRERRPIRTCCWQWTIGFHHDGVNTLKPDMQTNVGGPCRRAEVEGIAVVSGRSSKEHRPSFPLLTGTAHVEDPKPPVGLQCRMEPRGRSHHEVITSQINWRRLVQTPEGVFVRPGRMTRRFPFLPSCRGLCRRAPLQPPVKPHGTVQVPHLGR